MQTEKDVVLKLVAVLESSRRGEPYASDRAGEVRALWWVLSGEALPESEVLSKLCAKYDGTLTKERPGNMKINVGKMP